MFANDGRRLNHALRACLAEGARDACVLVTVVRTAGSTYRKSGAQMLVPRTGEPIGLLSGGCLEDDIVKSARALFAAGAAATKLLFFDLMPESEFLVGYGKGCSGQLTVLLERIDAARAASHGAVLDKIAAADAERAVALVYEAPEGSTLRVGDRVLAHEANISACPASLLTALVDAATAAKPQHFSDSKGLHAALFRIRPPQDLVIFGAGPDSPALARFADQLGWSVRICDHRPARLEAARYPASTAFVHYNPETLGDELETNARTAVVVMTHNLLVDAEILKWAAARPLAYLGLLGPSHRRDRIYNWLRSQGTDLEPQLAPRLFAPIGLDLGGDGGEWDIALAIVAQIQQLGNHGSARHKADMTSQEAKKSDLFQAPKDAEVVATCGLAQGDLANDQEDETANDGRPHAS